MVRKTVEKVVGRMYRHHEKTTGSLPTFREIREMERKAKKAAEKAVNESERK